MIIPTLVSIRAAGTASLLVSLPTVMVGVLRFRAQGAYRDRAMLAELALPMAAGSVAGAVLGAAALPLAPAAFLKLLLGGVLAASAAKLARKATGQRRSYGRTDGAAVVRRATDLAR